MKLQTNPNSQLFISVCWWSSCGLRCESHYRNLDRVRSECVWSEETLKWRIPDLVCSKTKLPPAGANQLRNNTRATSRTAPAGRTQESEEEGDDENQRSILSKVIHKLNFQKENISKQKCRFFNRNLRRISQKYSQKTILSRRGQQNFSWRHRKMRPGSYSSKGIRIVRKSFHLYQKSFSAIAEKTLL